MQVTTAGATTTTNHKTDQAAKLKLNTNNVEFCEENIDKEPRSPLQREIREWQHIDPDTGALLTKRLEADRWINGPSNKYGKVSNSQNIAQPNGTQQTKCKQLEILQAHTNKGHPVQVIRTLTSSRWSSTPVSPTIITTTEDSTQESRDLVHDVIEHHDDDDEHHHQGVSNNVGGRNGVKDESCNTSNLFYMHNNRILKPNTTIPTKISSTKSDDETKTTTTDRSWPTSQTSNNVGANCDAVSNKILEICEVSDTELNDVYDIDCNGIVTADEDYNNIQNDANIDHADDHDHEVYYRGKRVFDIAIHIESDTDTDTERPQFQSHHKNNKNTCNKINNNNKKKNNNNYSSDNTKLFQKYNKNNLLNTTPVVKVNNVMNSSFNNSPSTTLKNASTKITKTNDAINKNASKISLRAVVGDSIYNNTTTKNHHNQKTYEKIDASSLPSTSTVKATTSKNFGSPINGKSLFEKKQRQEEQQQIDKKDSTLRNGNIFIKSTLYGDNNKNNSKLISVKRCVGATAVVTNERSSDVDDIHDDDQQLQRKNSDIITPTRPEPSKPVQQLTCKNDWESFRLYDHGIDLSINSKLHNHEMRPRQRSYSISTDDLSNDANEEENFNDWQRVTKLRRSFQSHSKASTPSNDSVEKNFPQMSVSRPSDLPTNSVSVARLRTELEQGRRLQTTTHNPNADLNTLNHLFKSQERETPTTRTNALLTAETLQEIRAKLKKLSNESLYKADYLSANEPQQLQTIKNLHLPANIKLTDLNDTLNKANSLATRHKYRSSIDSIDWQNRRKSYGFENMTPSEEKSNLRTDNSTDSGLGRSGDIGNLSPISDVPRGTIVNFGQETSKLSSSSKVNIIPEKTVAEDLIKRHSIAVDASKYMGNNFNKKTTQILEVKSAANESNRVNAIPAKRVEFCKTEVHFAAESGRVNIVETDGKPPSNNNFRRRRRLTSASGPFQNLVKSATTATNNLNTNHNAARFGTDQPIGTTLLTYRTSLGHSEADVHQEEPMRQTSFISTTSANVTNDIDTDDISGIRGILKNKPIKPKPYHLGENISRADALWNFPLKSTVSVDVASHSNVIDNNSNNVGQINEKYQEQTVKGYSTKINLNQSGISRRRLSIQEQLLQNLHEQEQHIDQGLKSVALILKTMQSASDFDQAMRRLSITSVETIEPTCPSISTNPLLSPDHPSLPMGKLTSTNSYLFSDFRYQLNISKKPISQQLMQLRRMYELHASQEDDSADEEVSRYFRDISNIDEMNKSIEVSDSWRCNKVNRTPVKLQFDNKIQSQDFSNKSDIPKINDMNKELHTPHIYTSNCAPSHLISSVLVTKPRTFFLHSCRPTEKTTNEKLQTENLKIVKETRGARKLRDHELSYFGVQVVNDAEASTSPKLLSSMPSNNLRRTSLSQRKPNIQNETKNITKTHLRMSDEQQNNWGWANDKPDLLKHSSVVTPAETLSLRTKPKIGDNNEEHLYENISNEITSTSKMKPSYKEQVWTPYERKKDTTRDTQILSEMSYNADKSLKAVSHENALKDQRRHSMRRPSTPLETISEKSKAQKVSNTCIAVKISRNKSSTASTPDTASSLSRSSSFSSIDVCSKTCSRSFSSERGHRKENRVHSTYPRNYLTKAYNDKQPRSSSLESRKSTVDEKLRKVCPTCHNTLLAGDIRRDIEKSNSSKNKSIANTMHSSSRERAKCTTDHKKLQQTREPTPSQRKVSRNSSDQSVTNNRAVDTSATQNSFRKLTTALGLSKPAINTKAKVLESQQVDKQRETKSRSSLRRSSHVSKERNLTPTLPENRNSRNNSKTKKTMLEHTHSRDPLTHGKNTQSKRHLELYDYKPEVGTTSTTTTKIAAKHQRERSGKDRK